MLLGPGERLARHREGEVGRVRRRAQPVMQAGDVPSNHVQLTERRDDELPDQCPVLLGRSILELSAESRLVGRDVLAKGSYLEELREPDPPTGAAGPRLGGGDPRGEDGSSLVTS